MWELVIILNRQPLMVCFARAHTHAHSHLYIIYLQKAPRLQRVHYRDVVEERSALGICGWLLCPGGRCKLPKMKGRQVPSPAQGLVNTYDDASIISVPPPPQLMKPSPTKLLFSPVVPLGTRLMVLARLCTIPMSPTWVCLFSHDTASTAVSI